MSVVPTVYLRKKGAAKRENWKLLTLPNILTFVRIGVLPFLVGAFFCPRPAGDFIALCLFLLASFTDYADGYIARRFKQTSKFGAFLDPIADKLLISLVLLMLAGTGRISSYELIPASIILCREIVISGLREFLSAIEQELPVSRLAQYKTSLQMLALAALLLHGMVPKTFVLIVGRIALWVASALTLITGINYVRASMLFAKKQQKADKTAPSPLPPVHKTAHF